MAISGLPKWDFPSFLEGLSLRHILVGDFEAPLDYFPSFLEGLSLRQ